MIPASLSFTCRIVTLVVTKQYFVSYVLPSVIVIGIDTTEGNMQRQPKPPTQQQMPGQQQQQVVVPPTVTPSGIYIYYVVIPLPPGMYQQLLTLFLVYKLLP